MINHDIYIGSLTYHTKIETRLAQSRIGLQHILFSKKTRAATGVILNVVEPNQDYMHLEGYYLNEIATPKRKVHIIALP